MKKSSLSLFLFVLFLSFVHPVCAKEEKTLNLCNWANYMPDAVLKAFSDETGIKINYSIFESNEALYAKLKALDGKGYDLIAPSTYFVNRMRKEEMLIKLDKSKLPNFKNLDPKLLNHPYDPGNDHSMPYLWGTTGISLNSKMVQPDSIKRWMDLWDSRYQGSLLLLDDVRDVFSMALRTLGYSINDTDEAHIREAYIKLKELLPNIKVFNSQTPAALFIEEEVSLGQTWNGDAYKASQENPAIRYIYPKEGVMLWMDSFVIPKGAKHVENAHKFLDFLLRPEVARTICEELGYATPNIEAVKLLPEKLKQNRIIFPAEEDIRESEFQMDLGNAVTIYEKYWGLLKTGGKD